MELEVKEVNRFIYDPSLNAFNLKGMRLFGLPGSQTKVLSLKFPFLAKYDANGIESFGTEF